MASLATGDTRKSGGREEDPKDVLERGWKSNVSSWVRASLFQIDTCSRRSHGRESSPWDATNEYLLSAFFSVISISILLGIEFWICFWIACQTWIKLFSSKAARI
ncbi:hypothetical protein HNY73_000731 [Argiope bruennichi]|uniref:Transmembrane protein n=1 Tax=Argiope bruennichi TaxID=94029 RepID=A0A8T0FZ13_ARGBR|nr:hypothetical protein HNY73_000731 [Argiope bruennichi]